ncbi:MAG: alpha/beta hydrolase [Mycobacteriales bacterium]
MSEPLPEIRSLLAAQASAGPPDVSLPLRELRSACDAGILAMHSLVRDVGAPGVVRDLQVPVRGGAIPVRLYLPPDASPEPNPAAPPNAVFVSTPSAADPRPVHVHLHGGGWWMGSIETADPMARELCVSSGMAVLSVGYRLAPEHRWPTAAEDVYAVLRWLSDGDSGSGSGSGSDPLGFPPASLSIGGESAGANLAAAVALMCRDRGGPRLVAQWLDVPALDLTLPETPSTKAFGTGYGLELSLTASIRPWYIDEQDLRHPYASPALAADLSGLPPALVTTAEFDPLRDQGEAYAAALEQAGVQVRLRRASGHIHGSSWLTGLTASTAQWHDEVVADLVRQHRALAPAR